MGAGGFGDGGDGRGVHEVLAGGLGGFVEGHETDVGTGGLELRRLAGDLLRREAADAGCRTAWSASRTSPVIPLPQGIVTPGM